MNLLYHLLDDGVTVDGVYYRVNWQYYYILKIIELLEDGRLDEMEKCRAALVYFYAETIPPNWQGALQACFDFITAGNYQGGSGGGDSTGGDTPLYDYTQDHQLIYASMCQAYGEAWYHWHWWRWKAAFDHLPDDTPIKQVMSIRGRKIEAKMTPKEKQSLRQLKRLYALKREPQLTAKELEAQILAEIAAKTTT